MLQEDIFDLREHLRDLEATSQFRLRQPYLWSPLRYIFENSAWLGADALLTVLYNINAAVTTLDYERILLSCAKASHGSCITHSYCAEHLPADHLQAAWGVERQGDIWKECVSVSLFLLGLLLTQEHGVS